MGHKRRIGVVVAVLLVVGWALWNRRPRPGSIELIEDVTVADAGRAAVEKKAPIAKVTSVDAGVPEARTGPGQVLAKFGWGSGEGNLGRSRPDEANPEAPMSLTVDSLGQVWILDQVNERLVKLDRAGKPVGTVPLTVQSAQDVVVAPDGTALVMDRLVDKSIALIGPDGKPRGELPLIGKGLEESGASTGLFTDGKDVFVEREHGDSVRIGSTSGEAN
jgi:streptogramin lyase